MNAAAAVIGDTAACFAQDQVSRRDIPGVQQLFKVTVDASRRDITKVERGGTDSAYIQTAFENLLNERKIVVGKLLMRTPRAEFDKAFGLCACRWRAVAACDCNMRHVPCAL